eukprot:TRINITY_DN34014_c0_g1_i6.p1 TRINITY_DN34014_c0_g1~~TRINITY_DN34014_c0_g1_i6.p1  ORF type:complete len:568 (-),score=52.32 TRINITY_DN34014_c0_g1_i6:568-2271(-)
MAISDPVVAAAAEGSAKRRGRLWWLILGDGGAGQAAWWLFFFAWAALQLANRWYVERTQGLPPKHSLLATFIREDKSYWYMPVHFKRVRGRDPSCWEGDASFASCCISKFRSQNGTEIVQTGFFHPPGRTACWTHGYSFERCCIPAIPLEPQVFFPVAMESFTAARTDKAISILPPQRHEICPAGFRRYLVAGEVRAKKVFLERIRRILFPYEPYAHKGYAPLDSAVVSALKEDLRSVGVVIGDSISILPNFEALFWKTWYCLREDQDFGSFLQSVRTINEQVWAEATIALAKRFQERVMTARHASDAPLRRKAILSEILAFAWQLEAAAEEGRVHVNAFTEDELDPVCQCADGQWSCRWQRVPQWAWIAAALCVLPGVACLPRSLSALFRRGERDIEILDFWRAVMVLLVVRSHVEERLMLPLASFLPRLDFLGNSLAFALSIRFQGRATNVPMRMAQRWSRHLPLRIANVALDLYIVRGLLTRDFDARGLVMNGSYTNPRTLRDMSGVWNLATHAYRTSWLGPLAEVLEPLRNWSMPIRPVLQVSNLWFFRAEATLWALLMMSRS